MDGYPPRFIRQPRYNTYTRVEGLGADLHRKHARQDLHIRSITLNFV